ncbi:Acyl-CoA N-acyltransferase [Cordyceps fumosorosea ARSEF 2679]|uniref:Acyl-CoA N-acyltransferase n=1 Tax=Cordyceps fumosorosea (strain ARSEF 2679) TaxID=1081104 RepID=A0A167P7J4_CORFA|nr:Acyl-CoA N-acyltransferase [Cordyceps fumosorosea ARSEF 2679]OAA56372.1 Acyl-CoA N-acyltransferase [Cordyceps fumosorosea ARSEF 2679]
MDETNPFRSETLEYRGYDPDEHDAFFAALQKEPLALVSSSASVLRPMNKKAIEENLKDLIEKSLLFVIVYRVDLDPRLAIDVVREHQGKGYGAEMLDWTLAWAFRKAGLHRVELEYLGWNERVRPLYERAGFVEEGRRRKCFFKDGKWWDEVLMGILEDEWTARSQRARQA